MKALFRKSQRVSEGSRCSCGGPELCLVPILFLIQLEKSTSNSAMIHPIAGLAIFPRFFFQFTLLLSNKLIVAERNTRQ